MTSLRHYDDLFSDIYRPNKSLRAAQFTIFAGMADRPAHQTRQPTPGVHLAACWASLARRGCALRSPSMKTLAIFILCWLSALAAEASDVKVITMTTTNA